MLKRTFKLAVLLSAALAAQAAVARDITLFTGGDFSGREMSVRSDTRDLNQYGFNDRAASMMVRSGVWEVCVHADFGGECRVYEPGQYRSLDRLNGQISSVRMVAAANTSVRDERREERRERRANRRGGRDAELVLFDSTNLRGRSVPLRGDVGDLVSAGFNDRAQSMLIEGGSWEVCQHRDFGGMCRVYGPGQYNNLERSLQRAISSVRLVSNDGNRGNGYGPETGYGRGQNGYEERRGRDLRRQGGVELFSGGSFGGERIPVGEEVRDLDRMNFNDRAASLIVYEGQWQFCQHADFRGMCMTYGPGRYDRLGNLSNGISSMRRVR